MKKIFLIFLTPFTFCYGQKEKCGVVTEKQAKLPISYANIYFSNNSAGTIANEKGEFCLPEPAKKPDSVSISAFGYKKMSFLYENFLTTKDFMLEVLPINLASVAVKGRKGKVLSKEIGYTKKPFFTNGLTLNSNTRMATFVRNDEEKEMFLTNIYCRMKPIENDLVSAFNVRLRLYQNKDNLPDDDILIENVILKVPVNTKKIDFDIKKFGIKVPKNGFWIGIESIGYTDKNDVFIPIKDFQIGSGKAKKNVDPKLNFSERITPMYASINTDKGLVCTTRWNNLWKPFSIINAKRQTFLFGAKVEYYK